MALTAQLSCLLVLLAADRVYGSRDSLRAQAPGPQPLELKEVFRLFQIQFNRSYSSPKEYAQRLDIFGHNLIQAQRLQEEDLGTAEFGVTPFSDLTEEEFYQLSGNWRAPGGDPSMERKVGSEEWGKPVPRNCDWRKAPGVISPVKNQEKCECCWAMAAIGNIEAQWGIKVRQSVELSVQELLDCGRCGNGCKGGFVWDAFITVLNNSGLASEQDYPYIGHAKPARCLANMYRKVAWIQDFIMLPDNEDVIAQYLATQGPITVTINNAQLQHYQKGVIKPTSTNCDPQGVNHSVLLVGFGKSKTEKKKQANTTSSWFHRPSRSPSFWILKNSWGAEWGEEGYFRLHKGSNACGITKYPLTARVDRPAKKQPVSCPP